MHPQSKIKGYGTAVCAFHGDMDRKVAQRTVEKDIEDLRLRYEIDPQRLKMNIIEYFNGFSQDVQDIGDCQMLFLANNISRMKDTPLGTRIVEVHNGSSLFTGNAGGGESNLRTLDAIMEDIRSIERDTDGLLDEIMK